MPTLTKDCCTATRSKIKPGHPKEAPWKLQDASRCSKRHHEVHKCAKVALQEALWEAQAPQGGLRSPPGGSKRAP